MKLTSPLNFIFLISYIDDMNNRFMAGYVFGVLCSKGSLKYSEKNSTYFVSFETGDKDLSNKFSHMWKVVFSHNFKIYEKTGGNKTRFVFRLYDKKLIRRFYYTYRLRTGSKRWRVPKNVFLNMEMSKGFLSGFFDSGCYIRWRVRERRNKKEKIRNIRVVSPNRMGLESVKNLLVNFKIKPMIYTSGKNFCLDIEGKNKLELFENRVGFLLEKNKIRLQEALSYLSWNS